MCVGPVVQQELGLINVGTNKRKSYIFAAIVLSLSLHGAIIFAIGIRSGSMHREGNVTRKMHSDKLKIELIKFDSVMNKLPNKQVPLAYKPHLRIKGDKSQAVEQVYFSKENNLNSIPVMSTEPYYFKSDELTHPPIVLQDVLSSKNPIFASIINKYLILKLLVNEYGDIDRVLIEDSLISEEVEIIVMNEFLKIKFYPGTINDIPVKSQLTIEVTFDYEP